ncbi:MAG: hypothetical protein AAFQ92_27225 [Bacteroidota bacterium]
MDYLDEIMEEGFPVAIEIQRETLVNLALFLPIIAVLVTAGIMLTIKRLK